MLRSMLSFRPEDRPSARQILESETMAKWALPVYQKTRNTRQYQAWPGAIKSLGWECRDQASQSFVAILPHSSI